MKKYELIKEYPGSLKLGSIIVEQSGGCFEDDFDNIYYIGDILKYPEYWKLIDENAFGIKSFFVEGDLSIIMSEEGYIPQETDGVMKIQSIVRLSDKQVFKIGDYISLENSWGTENYIKEIYIKDKRICFRICSDGGVCCHYNQDLSRWKIIKKNPVFTTYDGVDMFEGDHFYVIEVRTLKFLTWSEDHKTSRIFRCSSDGPLKIAGELMFATKRAAERYIKFHKKTLSLADVFSIYPQFKKRDPKQNTNHADILIKKVLS